MATIMNDVPAPASGAGANVSPGYAAPRRRGIGINFRLVAFLAILSVPFFWVLYVFLDQAIHGGVNDHGSYATVDLKSMGNFPFDPVQGTYKDIPKRFMALDGRRVELEGQMYAPNAAGETVNEFQLVYNIQKCCFSGPPKVQERVFAIVPSNKTVRYFGQEVKVTGVLHVNIQKPAGEATTIYTLDVIKVKPL